MPGLLTTARHALWDALAAWPATSGVFAQKYTFDDPGSLLSEMNPGPADLPAIAILPTSLSPQWFTTQFQTWPLVFDVTVWTADWTLPTAEDLIEQVLLALYQAKPPGGSVPIVKAAVGHYPERLGPIRFEMLGGEDRRGVRLLQTTASLSLRLNVAPLD
jgi:hypothetical protein